jgi:hypothetical protein
MSAPIIASTGPPTMSAWCRLKFEPTDRPAVS